MSRRLAILGAGGHGRVVADSAASLGWSVTFFDDMRSDVIDSWPVGGKVADLLARAGQFDGVIVAVGINRLRLDLTLRLEAAGGLLVSIADVSSRIGSRVEIGTGTFLAPGTVVNTGARIGRACILNTSSSVDHDCVLGDGVHLSPGVRLSGTVTIGTCAWLGTGTSVRNDLEIGADVKTGVGSVIVNSIDEGLIVAGVPAVPLEKR